MYVIIQQIKYLKNNNAHKKIVSNTYFLFL